MNIPLRFYAHIVFLNQRDIVFIACEFDDFLFVAAEIVQAVVLAGVRQFAALGDDRLPQPLATAVEMVTEGALLIEDFREVVLDRPFVYMLIDCETNLPFFIGAMMNVEGG